MDRDFNGIAERTISWDFGASLVPALPRASFAGLLILLGLTALAMVRRT